MKKIYTAIDIGSDTIKFVVGEILKDKLNILSSYTEAHLFRVSSKSSFPYFMINKVKSNKKRFNC